MTTAVAKKQNGNQSVGFGNVVDNIFQNSLKRFFDDNFWERGYMPVSSSVPVNIRETEQDYQLDVIAPGCRKEDFNINIHDNQLVISFESKTENRKEDAGWVRNEFTQRSFSRSFMLDDTVDVNKINATYTDGILRISLAKNEKARKLSRHIEVK